MYKNNKIAVVVPAFQEELLIGKVIETTPDYVDKIVIVDDNSKDNTVAVVEEYIKKYPQKIVLIKHETNQGVGGAIASGYEWCRDNDIDAAAVMAGDAQMDPDDLPCLLDPVVSNSVDYAKGNRLFTDTAWETIPKVRYFGNSILSLLTKITSGYWHVADSQCGYTVINRKALHAISWNKMYKRYGQPNDLLVRLNINNFKVADVEVKPIYNIGEKSGIKPFRIIPKLSYLLLKLFFYRLYKKYIIRDFHPLVFFYFSGFIFLILDIFFIIRFLKIWFVNGSAPEITLLFIVLCTFSTILFTLFAMLFDMQYNTNQK